ncbi:1,4-alpha-glucan branching protein GlgB [Cytobacillus gottheilii]|uniref:1,4-alpha-glucan branching enzyme GlgB n=1 Tax=Cytobacillus gottheilii TaxID=859144 RepID=A0ABX8FAH0_9BACI|nr:1,4-alpha-glucan branching protein GlgB [Cytobacillus gottheilii]QVY60818.1 1,4-alpha-glucan branching protein GlgB [Cytobacillus gottheilii]
MDTVFPTDYELHLFHEGTLFEAYKLFGSHLLQSEEGVQTRFCVWAPNAAEVRIAGDFNNWNGEAHPLQKVNQEGVWFTVIPMNLEGQLYKYEIVTKEGKVLLKSDPYAFLSELRPRTASIVYGLDEYEWNDVKWLQKREKSHSLAKPMVIYEVHLGTWKKKNGKYLSYQELAAELIPYIKEHGFTHLEILPLVEHPLDISWGYQGTGYFSATSRYGSPKDLMYFIDQCHQHEIGVILDWVPGHFCKDAHGLYAFDGDNVYEYETEADRENHVWGTANFNLAKNEVQSFLISNAIFWLEKYHIDGFRVDAVSNIIYWPNRQSTEENPFGTAFLRKLNEQVTLYDPSVLMIAEDSTDWPQVTAPVHYGGLGFSYKWNMGWMNDVLSYMETHAADRKHEHGKMTFSLMYAFSENFILPFSHDEVVHGKKSLLDKMPGDYWQKFAQMRLLLAFMFAHPGKKLLFMGFELGMFSEWKDQDQLDWHLLQYDMHKKMNGYVKELIKLYKRSKQLYEVEQRHEGFEWIDADNKEQSIFSFIRRGDDPEEFYVVVCNFTDRSYADYQIGVPYEGEYREIFNSDLEAFGGTNQINKKLLKSMEIPFHGKQWCIQMTIPPFGASILRHVKKRKGRKGNGKEKLRSHAVSRGTGKQA